jgi:hypothetical protein
MHYTMLDRLTRNEHTSLFISYKVVNMIPEACTMKLFTTVLAAVS